jgi:hypothetical protein
VRLATTTFSFTNEWLARRYTVEQLLGRMAELDLGPGVELIGHQLWRSYPALSPRVLACRRLLDRLELEPAALEATVNLLRPAEEAVESLNAQIVAAQALGFPLLRLHVGIPLTVLERVAPVAERAGVTLATEVQGVQSPDDPAVVAVLACRERLDSPRIALALDFSVAMTAVPASFAAAVLAAGMTAEKLDELVALWADGTPIPEFFAALAATDAPAAALDEARSGFVRFGRQDPEAWLPLVPQIAYAHAKFWELDDAGDEPTVQNSELLGVLRRGGFDGFVASEWGGHAWLEREDEDAFVLVAQHHALMSRLEVDAGAGVGLAMTVRSNPRR